MRSKFYVGVAAAALLIPGAAFAQSTGSVDFEETTGEDIVVTGTRADSGVNGIIIPDSPKARQVLNNEFLQTQTAGNSVLDALNAIPGVNFTQSDAYGSSGGNIRIRGFDGNRISLTFDGFPLNDTGNYAIFSNQQLDPELVDEINVNLGATDVDSPTASAAGGTINYRTIVPSETLSATFVGSYGDDEYHRVFGLIETGNLTSFGTRAFLAASTATNNKFKGPGEIYKQQYNVGIYQPLGASGDFVRVSGHYNQNRNNFYRNPSVNDLRTLLGGDAVPPNAGATADNPIAIGDYDDDQYDTVFNFENDALCVRPTPVAGTVQRETTTPTGTTPLCTNYHNVRVNPSNTGNVRGNSRFTLTDKLTLTADAGYQYVLAHGGGITALAENSARARGGTPTAPGVDFNGDGDVLDFVQFFTPNITNTRRVTATASLIYDFTPTQRARVSYTYDRGRHRQTGEWGFLQANGDPENSFSGRNGTPVLTADGFQFQQRDRLSIALLNQISGEYIGRFFDEKLTVQLGIRAPFFKRELNQYCYTEARGSGFAYCTSEPASTLLIIAPDAPVPATGPTPYYAPFDATYKYDAILPSAGFVYEFSNAMNVFGSYSKGFSSPRTDNLYRAPIVDVEPEKTDSFDLGLRYTTRMIQAQAAAWYIGYKNRIVTSFNPDLGISIDRNVGKVESYGFDLSATVQPTDWLGLTALASYTNAELKDDVPLTGTTFAPTAGKKVTETPEWQVGGRAQFDFGPVRVGGEVKWVDERFATDVNDVVLDDYTLVDLDARFSLDQFGLEETYFQLNVANVFDEKYFGNISTQINAAGNPNFSVGYPRTFTGTFRVGF